MRLMLLNKLVFSIFCVGLILTPSAIFGQLRPQVSEIASSPKEKQLLKNGEEAFNKQQHDIAVDNFSKIIKSNKKHYDAATWLGVSYYLVGIPKRALKYLKHAEKNTTLKAFNNFYQGLCYDALRNRDEARAKYQVAANTSPKNTNSYRSMFELGVTDYNNKAFKQGVF